MGNQNFVKIDKNTITVKVANDNYIKNLGFDMYEIQFKLTNGNTINLRAFCKINTPELSAINFFKKNMIDEIFANYLELRDDIKSIIENGYFYYGNIGLNDFNRVLNRILNHINSSNRITDYAEQGIVTTDRDKKMRSNPLPPSPFGRGYTRGANYRPNTVGKVAVQTRTANTTGTEEKNKGPQTINRTPGIQKPEIGKNGGGKEANNGIQPSKPANQPVNLPQSPFVRGYTRGANYRPNTVRKVTAQTRTANTTGTKGKNKGPQTINRTPGNKSAHPQSTFRSKVLYHVDQIASKTYCMADMHGEKNAYD